jgi:hypothetical protein
MVVSLTNSPPLYILLTLSLSGLECPCWPADTATWPCKEYKETNPLTISSVPPCIYALSGLYPFAGESCKTPWVPSPVGLSTKWTVSHARYLRDPESTKYLDRRLFSALGFWNSGSFNRWFVTFFFGWNRILFAICIYTFSKLVLGLGAMASRGALP